MSIAPPAFHTLPYVPGSPLRLKLRLKAAPSGTTLDLTGAQVRLAFWSADGRQQYASCLADLSAAATGRVDLALTAVETEAIPADARYDCLLINSLGKRRYLFYGGVEQGVDLADVIDGGTDIVAPPSIIDGGTAMTAGVVVINAGTIAFTVIDGGLASTAGESVVSGSTAGDVVDGIFNAGGA